YSPPTCSRHALPACASAVRSAAMREPDAAVTLRWSIRQRFRDYVREIPDGREELLGEARYDEHNTIEFPADGTVPPSDRNDGILRFTGGVAFHGHRGALSVRIVDPWIELTPDGIHITVRDLLDFENPNARFVIGKSSAVE